MSQQRDGTWAAGSLSALTTIGAAFGPVNICGSNNPAKSVSVNVYNGVPSGMRLTCDNPTRGRQAPTAEDLITGRIAMIQWPVLSPVTNKSYVSNEFFTFALAANVPGATKWKVQLSSLDGRIRAPMQETRNRVVIGGEFNVGPFDIDQRLRGNTVVYDFYACTNDNRCTRRNRGGFYACSKPPIGEGCALGNMIGGGGSGGGGSTGGGTTPPANTLSFARDLYPLITATSPRADLGQGMACIACHSSNGTYPQKRQTNASGCNVASEPIIPFTTGMSAPEMLRRLKCLKASSTQGTYQRALGKIYVVPGDYNNSGLHWKAQASNAFSPAIKTLIQTWIAQGANP